MTSRKNLDVRRAKSSLIATFVRAHPPLIWRFDLERNHSFTLGLQGGDAEWELGVTSPKGEFHPVARFPAREDAEEAFAAVSAALAKGQEGWGGRLLKAVGALVILYIVLMLLLAGFRSLHPADQMSQSVEEEDAPAAPPPYSPPVPVAHAPPPAAPPPAEGVPLPADQVLKPPSP